MAWVGILFGLSKFFYVALAITGVLFFYQLKLLKTQDKENYFMAFLNNNLVGLLLFIGIYL